jgi:glycosyltransferase involved in cell wall biosynthesis
VLERVLDACLEQTVDDSDYEIVIVDDGSTDSTAAVIERWAARARCRFTAIAQPNAGLARARNAGIARATGERIIFIDDDVLPLPNFVEEHLRAAGRHPTAIVRGGAIEVESLDDLPMPIWTIKNYSGNYFWTTNVSVPLATIMAIGGFDESFSEYGWEDIDVGLRLRARGVRAIFHPDALVYHYKPRPRADGVEKMLRQSRAQARTAARLVALHPNWRAHLATGINPVQRGFHGLLRSLRFADRFHRRLERTDGERALSRDELRAARALANEAYFEELERVLRPPRS